MKVGDLVETYEQFFELPVGTVIKYVKKGWTYTKLGDNQWRCEDYADNGISPDGHFMLFANQITSLPLTEVTEEELAETLQSIASARRTIE